MAELREYPEYRKKAKKERQRRSGAEMEHDIMEAAKVIIKEVGFDKATIISVAAKANVHANAIYNRYGNLEGALEKLSWQYISWMNEKMMRAKGNKSPIKRYKEAFHELLLELIQDDIMQALLIWELCGNNRVTKVISEARKGKNQDLFDYLNTGIPESDVDFNILTALLISGISYFVIHQKNPVFGVVDFTNEERV